MSREIKVTGEQCIVVVHAMDGHDYVETDTYGFLRQVSGLLDSYMQAAISLSEGMDPADPSVQAATAMVMKCEALVHGAKMHLDQVRPLLNGDCSPAAVGFPEFDVSG